MAARRRRPPPTAPQESLLDRRTRIIAVLLIGFGLVLAWWTQRKIVAPAPAASTASEGETQTGSAALRGPFAGIGMTAATTTPPPPPGPPEPAPVIDSIVLEKTEVCAGEENLVTVAAHTVNGTDPELHYVIDGHMGQAYPVTLWKGDDGIIGEHTITVFGRNNVATTVPLPRYEVKDCRPKYIASVATAVRSNTWADFDFTARIVGLPAAPSPADKQRGGPPPVPKPFNGVSFTWSFGDGETVTTLTPVVEHNYEGRPQKTEYSYYVIGVTIRGEKGESVTGRTSLALQNPSFEALSQKGIVALLISLDPRFPELGSDGRVTQHVRIWHNQPQAVTIEHAALTKYYKSAAGETKPEEVDVSSVLGTTSIPAGKEGITVTVTIDPQSEEEVFTKTWSVTGKSAEGYPVLGSFSVMLPPQRPARDAGSQVFDPLLQQKIMATKEMLGKDIVTDEDIWRLEREGAFASLKVSPDQAAAAASAAIADAIRKGPPSAQPPPSKGAPSPTSTGQQAAQASQSGSAGTEKK